MYLIRQKKVWSLISELVAGDGGVSGGSSGARRQSELITASAAKQSGDDEQVDALISSATAISLPPGRSYAFFGSHKK